MRSSILFVAVSAVHAFGSLSLAQTWQPAPSFLPGGRVFAAAVVHNGTIFALGGSPWVAPDLDGSVHALPAGPMNWETRVAMRGMGRVVGHGAGIDGFGRIVVFGGENLDNGDPAETTVYDLIEGPSMGLARRPNTSPTQYFAWCTDNLGRLYTLGGGKGREAVDEPGARNEPECWRYTASSDTWQNIAPMPQGVGDACAVFDGSGHILVIGGVVATGGARTANVAQYDPASNTWSNTAVPDMPVAINGARAVVGANGWVYVMGGETGPLLEPVPLNTTWIYRPDLVQWTVGPNLAEARRNHAAVLGPDNFIYVMGGDGANGPLSSCEKVYTPSCPTVTERAPDAMPWAGGSIGLVSQVAGGTPMTFAWTKDGITVSDGTTPGGSTISGATTTTLTITALSAADSGAYRITATNACGVGTSLPTTLSVRIPPAIPTRWSVRSIHPAWSSGPSYANAVSQGRIVGRTNLPTTLPDGRVMNIDHPVRWDTPTSGGIDITPPGSIGGSLTDISGDIITGWYWHLYQCYSGGQWYTCGWQSAGYWDAPTNQFHEVHVSGAEFDTVSATDGVRMVGSATYDGSGGVHFGVAVVWSPPNYGPFSLQTPGTSQSSLSAVEGEHLYGSIQTPLPGPMTHAAMWTGPAHTFTDLHPAGYSGSFISDAHDGQVVGSGTIGVNAHAGIWVGSTFQDMNPPGAASSSITATFGGLQLGSVPAGPGLWNGTAASFFSLASFVPPGFATGLGAVFANDLEIAPDGTVTVVGAGWNPAASRYEAVVWQSLANCPADYNADGAVTSQDFFDFIAAFFAALPSADFNADGAVNSQDFFDFLAAFFAGC